MGSKCWKIRCLGMIMRGMRISRIGIDFIGRLYWIVFMLVRATGVLKIII